MQDSIHVQHLLEENFLLIHRAAFSASGVHATAIIHGLGRAHRLLQDAHCNVALDPSIIRWLWKRVCPEDATPPFILDNLYRLRSALAKRPEDTIIQATDVGLRLLLLLLAPPLLSGASEAQLRQVCCYVVDLFFWLSSTARHSKLCVVCLEVCTRIFHAPLSPFGSPALRIEVPRRAQLFQLCRQVVHGSVKATVTVRSAALQLIGALFCTPGGGESMSGHAPDALRCFISVAAELAKAEKVSPCLGEGLLAGLSDLLPHRPLREGVAEEQKYLEFLSEFVLSAVETSQNTISYVFSKAALAFVRDHADKALASALVRSRMRYVESIQLAWVHRNSEVRLAAREAGQQMWKCLCKEIVCFSLDSSADAKGELQHRGQQWLRELHERCARWLLSPFVHHSSYALEAYCHLAAAFQRLGCMETLGEALELVAQRAQHLLALPSSVEVKDRFSLTASLLFALAALVRCAETVSFRQYAVVSSLITWVVAHYASPTCYGRAATAAAMLEALSALYETNAPVLGAVLSRVAEQSLSVIATGHLEEREELFVGGPLPNLKGSVPVQERCAWMQHLWMALLAKSVDEETSLHAGKRQITQRCLRQALQQTLLHDVEEWEVGLLDLKDGRPATFQLMLVHGSDEVRPRSMAAYNALLHLVEFAGPLSAVVWWPSAGDGLLQEEQCRTWWLELLVRRARAHPHVSGFLTLLSATVMAGPSPGPCPLLVKEFLEGECVRRLRVYTDELLFQCSICVLVGRGAEREANREQETEEDRSSMERALISIFSWNASFARKDDVVIDLAISALTRASQAAPAWLESTLPLLVCAAQGESKVRLEQWCSAHRLFPSDAGDQDETLPPHWKSQRSVALVPAPPCVSLSLAQQVVLYPWSSFVPLVCELCTTPPTLAMQECAAAVLYRCMEVFQGRSATPSLPSPVLQAAVAVVAASSTPLTQVAASLHHLLNKMVKSAAGTHRLDLLQSLFGTMNDPAPRHRGVAAALLADLLQESEERVSSSNSKQWIGEGVGHLIGVLKQGCSAWQRLGVAQAVSSMTSHAAQVGEKEGLLASRMVAVIDLLQLCVTGQETRHEMEAVQQAICSEAAAAMAALLNLDGSISADVAREVPLPSLLCLITHTAQVDDDSAMVFMRVLGAVVQATNDVSVGHVLEQSVQERVLIGEGAQMLRRLAEGVDLTRLSLKLARCSSPLLPSERGEKRKREEESVVVGDLSRQNLASICAAVAYHGREALCSGTLFPVLLMRSVHLLLEEVALVPTLCADLCRSFLGFSFASHAVAYATEEVNLSSTWSSPPQKLLDTLMRIYDEGGAQDALHQLADALAERFSFLCCASSPMEIWTHMIVQGSAACAARLQLLAHLAVLPAGASLWAAIAAILPLAPCDVGELLGVCQRAGCAVGDPSGRGMCSSLWVLLLIMPENGDAVKHSVQASATTGEEASSFALQCWEEAVRSVPSSLWSSRHAVALLDVAVELVFSGTAQCRALRVLHQMLERLCSAGIHFSTSAEIMERGERLLRVVKGNEKTSVQTAHLELVGTFLRLLKETSSTNDAVAALPDDGVVSLVRAYCCGAEADPCLWKGDVVRLVICGGAVLVTALRHSRGGRGSLIRFASTVAQNRIQLALSCKGDVEMFETLAKAGETLACAASRYEATALVSLVPLWSNTKWAGRAASFNSVSAGISSFEESQRTSILDCFFKNREVSAVMDSTMISCFILPLLRSLSRSFQCEFFAQHVGQWMQQAGDLSSSFQAGALDLLALMHDEMELSELRGPINAAFVTISGGAPDGDGRELTRRLLQVSMCTWKQPCEVHRRNRRAAFCCLVAVMSATQQCDELFAKYIWDVQHAGGWALLFPDKYRTWVEEEELETGTPLCRSPMMPRDDGRHCSSALRATLETLARHSSVDTAIPLLQSSAFHLVGKVILASVVCKSATALSPALACALIHVGCTAHVPSNGDEELFCAALRDVFGRVHEATRSDRVLAHLLEQIPRLPNRRAEEWNGKERMKNSEHVELFATLLREGNVGAPAPCEEAVSTAVRKHFTPRQRWNVDVALQMSAILIAQRGSLARQINSEGVEALYQQLSSLVERAAPTRSLLVANVFAVEDAALSREQGATSWQCSLRAAAASLFSCLSPAAELYVEVLATMQQHNAALVEAILAAVPSLPALLDKVNSNGTVRLLAVLAGAPVAATAQLSTLCVQCGGKTMEMNTAARAALYHLLCVVAAHGSLTIEAAQLVQTNFLSNEAWMYVERDEDAQISFLSACVLLLSRGLCGDEGFFSSFVVRRGLCSAFPAVKEVVLGLPCFLPPASAQLSLSSVMEGLLKDPVCVAQQVWVRRAAVLLLERAGVGAQKVPPAEKKGIGDTRSEIRASRRKMRPLFSPYETEPDQYKTHNENEKEGESETRVGVPLPLLQESLQALCRRSEEAALQFVCHVVRRAAVHPSEQVLQSLVRGWHGENAQGPRVSPHSARVVMELMRKHNTHAGVTVFSNDDISRLLNLTRDELKK